MKKYSIWAVIEILDEDTDESIDIEDSQVKLGEFDTLREAEVAIASVEYLL